MVKKATAHKFLSGITTGGTELGMPSTPLAVVDLYCAVFNSTCGV
jgi:hypothetical protein